MSRKIIGIPIVLAVFLGCARYPLDLSIVSPVDGDTVIGTVTVEFEFEDDNQQLISNVFYYVDDESSSHIWRPTEHGYQWPTESLAPDNTHKLRVEFWDTEEVIGMDSIEVMVSNPLRWSIETAYGWGHAMAMADDTTIYCQSFGYVLILNPDGEVLSEFETPATFVSHLSIGPDGTLYMGSSEKTFYALNPDGSSKWSHATGNLVGSAAVGGDSTVYVGSDALYALDPDGNLEWSYPTGWYIPGSSAIGSDGTVYFASTDSCIYALNPDGSLRWKYSTGGQVHSSPAIDDDGTVYVGADRFYAFSPDGTVKWVYEAGGGSPLIGEDGSIYFTSSDYSCILDRDGNLLNRIDEDLFDVHGSISAGDVIYSANDQYLDAYDLLGNLLWRYHLDVNPAPPIIGPDGTVYVYSLEGKVFAFQGSGPLASSPWPMSGHDLKHTCRAGGP